MAFSFRRTAVHHFIYTHTFCCFKTTTKKKKLCLGGQLHYAEWQNTASAFYLHVHHTQQTWPSPYQTLGYSCEHPVTQKPRQLKPFQATKCPMCWQKAFEGMSWQINKFLLHIILNYCHIVLYCTSMNALANLTCILHTKKQNKTKNKQIVSASQLAMATTKGLWDMSHPLWKHTIIWF